MTQSIRAHFDGKYIVPDEPVELPVDKGLILKIDVSEKSSNLNISADERRKRLRKLAEMMAGNPEIPVEATRRINMYDDDRY